jgi:hypothetical protein
LDIDWNGLRGRALRDAKAANRITWMDRYRPEGERDLENVSVEERKRWESGAKLQGML